MRVFVVCPPASSSSSVPLAADGSVLFLVSSAPFTLTHTTRHNIFTGFFFLFFLPPLVVHAVLEKSDRLTAATPDSCLSFLSLSLSVARFSF